MEFMPLTFGLAAIAIAVLLISFRLIKVEKKLGELIEVLKTRQGTQER
jgi:hypothetical protein